MGARYPRWGGGPSVVERKARGSGTVGRNPGVRPVAEPVLDRRSVGGIGERSRSGPGAGGGGEAVLVVILGAEVLMLDLGDGVAEVLEEDMLRGGSQWSKGKKTARGAHTVGEGRVVSHKRRHSRGGCRNTVIIYRSMPLRGERQ